jgi:hypothetical protein
MIHTKRLAQLHGHLGAAPGEGTRGSSLAGARACSAAPPPARIAVIGAAWWAQLQGGSVALALVLALIHSIACPDSLTYLVPPFLKWQCD